MELLDTACWSSNKRVYDGLVSWTSKWDLDLLKIEGDFHFEYEKRIQSLLNRGRELGSGRTIDRCDESRCLLTLLSYFLDIPDRYHAFSFPILFPSTSLSSIPLVQLLRLRSEQGYGYSAFDSSPNAAYRKARLYMAHAHGMRQILAYHTELDQVRRDDEGSRCLVHIRDTAATLSILHTGSQ